MKLTKAFKSLLLVSLFAVLSVVSVSAASDSGVYGGNDKKSLTWAWHTGFAINGDYTQATATNRTGYPAYMKRVYARSGVDGSYSGWVASGTHSISHKDYGPYRTDLYDARFYWEYD